MLRDIFDITNYKAKVTLRVFDMSEGHLGEYEDIMVTIDNVDYYNDNFSISCLVPMEDELLIEGTI